MTFEVILKEGLGGPYYVEAEDAAEATKKGVARLRYHQIAMDFRPTEHVIAEVKICNKKEVQYA